MTAQAGGAPSSLNRDAVRRAMRRRRRALTAAERAIAAQKIAHHLGALPLVRPGARIAVYCAAQGEVDLRPFMKLARARGCRLYLPRIVNVRLARMEFFAFESGGTLRPNVFGIPEVHGGNAVPIAVRRLDLILAPLVAFDALGWRLGMGMGYYDRRLSGLRPANAWRRPKFIGVAYEWQRVASVDPEAWDVRLDAVATERGVHRATGIHSSS